MDKIVNINASYGVTNEALNAICELAKHLPPVGKNEEELIRNNPNLSRFQKWRLIRKLRK